MWNDDIVTTEKIVPSNIHLKARVKELFLKLKLAQPDSYEVMELEELVSFVMEESFAQKNKLVLLHERQEAMINVLRKKLKLKV